MTRRRIATFLGGFLILIPALNASAGNPILAGRGVCDPEIRIYNDRAYLYATHDASIDSKKFVMDDWWIWSSEDLLNWKPESVLKPEQTYYGKPDRSCWATCAATHDGKYFFYFSRGPKDIGVVQSDTPVGPWKDPLGKPLVARDSLKTSARDPAILQRPDGTNYMVFGTFDYFIGQFNPDMISFIETPKPIDVQNKFGPYGAGKMDDKPFLHERDGKFYLSWGCYYAMADNVYGPYVYKGCVITKDHTDPAFQKALTYDRHGTFFEFHRQWYYFCNDQSWPGSTAHFRNTVASYMHYRDNGEMAPVELNTLGVGQYDASPAISHGVTEAENYFDAQGGRQQESPDGGFEVADLRSGDTLAYPNVMNLPTDARVYFRYSNGNAGATTIEIHADRATGPLLATCTAGATGAWNQYQTAGCKLKTEAGTKNLTLVVRGGAGELIRLNWMCFGQ